MQFSTVGGLTLFGVSDDRAWHDVAGWGMARRRKARHDNAWRDRAWMTDQNARTACLERDDYECQLSKLFGIAHLSGKPCSKDLEVHHVTYKRYGSERVEDLVTVCTRCHDILTDAIRRERYSTRLTPNRCDGDFGLKAPPPDTEVKREETTVQDYRRCSTIDAQRETRRQCGRVCNGNERDQLEPQEDSSRLPKVGPTRILRGPLPG